jgi:Ca2+-binding EF-hand superfamily protein
MCTMTETNRPQRAKKSETLEVRIPFETKQAFLTACREDGTTASEVVRGSVQTYLDGRERPTQQPNRTLIMNFPQPVRRYGPRIAASAIAAIGLTTFAVLPSAAAPDFQATFKKLDVNGDGVLSADEFAGSKPGGEARDVVVETRIHKSTDGAAPPAAARAPGLKQDAFTFWLPDELGAPASDKEQHQYKVITKHEIRTDEDGGDKAAAPSEITFSMDDFRKKEFESFDGDRDGKVSYTEYSARQRAMMTRGFEILDANGDKSLSQDEYARIVSPPMPRIGDGDEADAPKVSIQGGPKVSPEALKAAFTKLDINKDNKLSLQEYLPPA